jgi:hypothetical protein
MSTAVVRETEKHIARPLRVLVPLIKDDLEHAEKAGMPYYRAAGEKMIEAKAQMKQGEFLPWLKRHFPISPWQAKVYMKLAAATADKQNRGIPNFSSLNDFLKQTGDKQYTPTPVRSQPWHDPVKQIVSRVDVDTLNIRKAELTRIDEREAQRKLALQLIDIGYKALATKLHPDSGGSRDAMARLNQVRDRLKAHA